ncbi:hypothetical protein LY12_004306 [Prauserella alba]|uniref:Uncharacterized protein n=1 Tax=Prauserella alba TaxID=176898 RepID=A0ABN1VG10_9PSEU|nr:hypothetical protein [Prauserella alba]
MDKPRAAGTIRPSMATPSTANGNVFPADGGCFRYAAIRRNASFSGLQPDAMANTRTGRLLMAHREG